MLVTARIAGFLLLLVLATAYIVQGEDIYAAGKCKLIDVNERKGTEITSENKNMGRKMVRYYDFIEMEMMKEIGMRAKYYTRKSRMLMSKESHGARFVAFNADYKGPRRHPPKNN